MKEYFASTGGRHTFADDIINLQDLALSATALFAGCDNFIISGCELSADELSISTGMVWLAGKIRKFDGVTNPVATGKITFPYYIYEKYTSETTKYADDINKEGRRKYECAGSSVIPTASAGSSLAPQSIVLASKDYAPRLSDKFFGKYAILKSGCVSQTIAGNITVNGKIVASGAIEGGDIQLGGATHTIKLSPDSSATNAAILSVTKTAGGSVVGQIAISTNGTISLNSGTATVLSVDKDGKITSTSIALIKATIGKLTIDGLDLYDDTTDATSEIAINKKTCGGEARSFIVYNGNTTALLSVNGGATSSIKISSTIFQIESPTITLAGVAKITWGEIASMDVIADKTMEIKSTGDIKLSSTRDILINAGRDLKIKGVTIDDLIANKITANNNALDTKFGGKVDTIPGKGLSTNDFTSALKTKLEGIKASALTGDDLSGYLTASEAKDKLSLKSDGLNNYIGYLVGQGTPKEDAQKNLREQINAQKSIYDSGWLLCPSVDPRSPQRIYARQIGNVVSVQGEYDTLSCKVVGSQTVMCYLPPGIGVPKSKVWFYTDESNGNKYRYSINAYICSQVDASVSSKSEEAVVIVHSWYESGNRTGCPYSATYITK